MNDNLKKTECSDSEEEGEIRLSEIEHPSLQVMGCVPFNP